MRVYVGHRRYRKRAVGGGIERGVQLILNLVKQERVQRAHAGLCEIAVKVGIHCQALYGAFGVGIVVGVVLDHVVGPHRAAPPVFRHLYLAAVGGAVCTLYQRALVAYDHTLGLGHGAGRVGLSGHYALVVLVRGGVEYVVIRVAGRGHAAPRLGARHYGHGLLRLERMALRPFGGEHAAQVVLYEHMVYRLYLAADQPKLHVAGEIARKAGRGKRQRVRHLVGRMAHQGEARAHVVGLRAYRDVQLAVLHIDRGGLARGEGPRGVALDRIVAPAQQYHAGHAAGRGYAHADYAVARGLGRAGHDRQRAYKQRAAHYQA